MESLRKSLAEYFKYLGKHSVDMNVIVNRASKPIEALKHLSDQHRLVSKAEVDSLPIGRIPGIKENLLFKIESVINEEIVELEGIIKQCKTSNMLLKKKLKNVKKCVEKVGALTAVEDRKTLCFGTASYPSILNMIEWADDSWRLDYALYVKFSTIVLTVQSEDDKQIAALKKNYLHSEERTLFLERVFAMTKKFVDDS